MAKPIAFKPITVDFKADLVRKLEKAPEEHAEALLLAYDVLEEAHRKGLLSLLHGAIGAKDTIFNTLSKYAAQPEGVAAIRNLLTAAKILTELDPEVLDQLSKVMAHATKEHQAGARSSEPVAACKACDERRQPPRAFVHDAGSLGVG